MLVSGFPHIYSGNRETLALEWLLLRLCVETYRETFWKLMETKKSTGFQFPVYRVGNLETFIGTLETLRETIWKLQV